MQHHGINGEHHSGPGGSFDCEQCEVDREKQDENSEPVFEQVDDRAMYKIPQPDGGTQFMVVF
jgi:hypothetical protein